MIVKIVVVSFLILISLMMCGKSSFPVTIIESRSPCIGTDSKLSESVGIETLGGVFTPLLKKGSTVPCEVSEVFSTAEDNQDQISIRLFRGNGKIVKNCQSLGYYQIIKIPRASRGVPKIEVTFEVKNGNIQIHATDLASRKRLTIVKS